MRVELAKLHDQLNATMIYVIPYLEQTILVIWTLITIIVLRIFDIIFAMTNGEWQTEVLVLEMI